MKKKRKLTKVVVKHQSQKIKKKVGKLCYENTKYWFYQFYQHDYGISGNVVIAKGTET